MADFLTPVTTRKVKDAEPLVREIKTLEIENEVSVDSIDSALEVLKNQPSRGTLSNALTYLTANGVSLLLPEPRNASIAYQLVNDTIPSYWRTLKASTDASLVAQILRNPTGLGHIITRLRTLIADSRQKKAPNGARNTLEHIEDLIDLLDRILRSDHTSISVMKDTLTYGKSGVQKKLIWREYLAQTASGRILAIVAEAEDVLKKGEITRNLSWIADGSEYAAWLGSNIVALVKSEDTTEDFSSAVVELCSKTLGLGYTGNNIQGRECLH